MLEKSHSVDLEQFLDALKLIESETQQVMRHFKEITSQVDNLNAQIVQVTDTNERLEMQLNSQA